MPDSKFYLVLVDGHTYWNKVRYSGPWGMIKNGRISLRADKPFFSLVDTVWTVGLLVRVVPWASPQTSIPGSIPGLGTGRLLRWLSLWKKDIYEHECCWCHNNIVICANGKGKQELSYCSPEYFFTLLYGCLLLVVIIFSSTLFAIFRHFTISATW